METELKTVIVQLPDIVTIRALLNIYFSEVAWMHRVITQKQADDTLAYCAQIPHIRSTGHYGSVNSIDQVTRRLSNIALIASVCACAVIFGNFNEDVSKALTTRYGGQHGSTYGVLLDLSHRALEALDLEESPSLDCVRTYLLMTYCLSAVRSPAAGMSALWHAIRIAFSMQLDCDPVDNFTVAEGTDRTRLFASLCVLDWLHAGDVKRHYLISPDNCTVTHHFGIGSSSTVITKALRIKLAIGSISRKVLKFDDDEYGNLLLLKQLDTELKVLKNMCLHLDRSGDNKYQVKGLEMSIEWQLLKLHQPYYARGWKEEAYFFSKESCITVALSIVEQFHSAFFWLIPQDQLSLLPRQPTAQEQVYTRVWLVSHSCISASIFLLEHTQMLEQYPDLKSSSMRERIFEDLVTTRYLLQTIASRSTIATNGITALGEKHSINQLMYSKLHLEVENDHLGHNSQGPFPDRRHSKPSTSTDTHGNGKQRLTDIPALRDTVLPLDANHRLSETDAPQVVDLIELIPNIAFNFPSSATTDFINKLDHYLDNFTTTDSQT
ncbi:hypothetical protein CBS101457_006943 [Exobasidium rhododendri]|nr:hypothetical protein CBS101457_006943 [Exobasidium rhododendri]